MGQNERKTTSASKTGLHFGHLKACAQNSLLTEFESSIAHIPYVSGYTPQQWKEGTIVMIKKREGLNNIKKLRSLVLTESDFNFNNKILGRRSIQHAEDIQGLAPEQYGSRKFKCSIDQALHKKITYDIMRQTKRSGLLCSNDAKSCFDQIVHSIAALAYKRIGIQQPPIECMLSGIQEMNYHISTSFGLSFESFNKHNTDCPLQGILQGNGAAPTTWVLISVPLLNMLRKKGHGAKFLSPLSKHLTHIVGFAFVDDTDLLTFDMFDETKSWENLSECMQEAIDRWEGGLKTTGGAIVPEKSWVFPISFKFDNKGSASYKTLAEIDTTFTVLNQDDSREVLACYEPTDGKETLGVFLSPEGNNDAAFDALQSKAQQWRDNILAGHLNPSLAWQAAQTTIMKTLEYPLPALTLDYDECNKLMQIVKTGLLAKARISRSFPSDALYGPSSEGGLNLNHLYVTQGLLHLEKFVRFLGSDSVTGNLLTVTMELCILESGIGRNLFQLDYNKYDMLLSPSWIKSLWKFSSEYGITIIDRIHAYPQISRENDVFLMEAFEAQGFSPKVLQVLNRCRIYLQVFTLSDLMTCKGDTFTNTFLCQRDHQRRNNYHWPFQPQPSQNMIKTWKKALRKTFQLKSGVTTYKLGNWLHSNFNEWVWFYHPSSKSLYQRFGCTWKIWKRETNRGRMGSSSKFKYFTQGTQLPPSCRRATVKFWSQSRITHTGSAISYEGSDTTHSNSLTPQHFALDTSQDNDDMPLILDAIRNNTLHVVSDGSYFPEDHVGAAGWVMQTHSGTARISGSQVTPGTKLQQNACRSEIAGIYYAMLHLYQYCQLGNITSGSILIHCDGLSAIQAINRAPAKVSTAKKNFDLLNSIISLRLKLPLKITLEHIQGHQDLGTAYHKLSTLAQLNILADDLAKSKATQSLQHSLQIPSSSLPFSPCDIMIYTKVEGTLKINTDLVSSLRYLITRDYLFLYWIGKKNLEAVSKKVDWELRNKSASNKTRSEQQWLCKHTTGFCGVGTMLVKYKYQTHSNCPRCGESSEKPNHVLQCNGEGVQALWTAAIDDLEKWMKKMIVIVN